jgi:hypothetical protein
MPIPGTWPPAPTTDEVTVAGLSPDGKHVRGWVKLPAGAVWKPEDWFGFLPAPRRPPDLDRLGEIVDVTPDSGDARLGYGRVEQARAVLGGAIVSGRGDRDRF